MSLYFLLGSLTHDGQRMLHGNPNLIVDRARDLKISGAEILGQYAVLGRYDFVMIVEANANDAVARVSLELGNAHRASSGDSAGHPHRLHGSRD